MSDQNDIKIIVDTNLWVSMLIGQKLASLKNLLIKGNVKIFSSEELFEEISRVLDYPKLQEIIQKDKLISEAMMKKNQPVHYKLYC